MGLESTAEAEAYDRRYTGFFRVFNAGSYHEAHDVLEHLWLETIGPERDFYKALIQIAGAFHHLDLQRKEPFHRIHGRRLAPAARLLRRSAALLAPYVPEYRGIAVADLREFLLRTADAAAGGGNMLVEDLPPQLPEPR